MDEVSADSFGNTFPHLLGKNGKRRNFQQPQPNLSLRQIRGMHRFPPSRNAAWSFAAVAGSKPSETITVLSFQDSTITGPSSVAN